MSRRNRQCKIDDGVGRRKPEKIKRGTPRDAELTDNDEFGDEAPHTLPDPDPEEISPSVAEDKIKHVHDEIVAHLNTFTSSMQSITWTNPFTWGGYSVKRKPAMDTLRRHYRALLKVMRKHLGPQNPQAAAVKKGRMKPTGTYEINEKGYEVTSFKFLSFFFVLDYLRGLWCAPSGVRQRLCVVLGATRTIPDM